MKLKEIKIKGFNNAKNVTVSNKYIITCTGRRALIYDSNLLLVREIKGLDYCYKAEVSPDEKYLLLISNGNRFWIVSLEDFSIKSYTIRGSYNGNLEGKGCWSFDGKKIYFCVTESKQSFLSALRSYSIENMKEKKDYLPDKYLLNSIKSVQCVGKYLLSGYNRDEDKYYIIWFDGAEFEEIQLDGFEYTIFDVSYDEQRECCIVYGSGYSFVCDSKGKILGKIDCIDKNMHSYINGIENIKNSKDNLEGIKCLSSILGSENLAVPNSVISSCCLKNGTYSFWGTFNELICINNINKKTEIVKKIPYGVYGIIEFGIEQIIISTMDGLRLYKIEE